MAAMRTNATAVKVIIDTEMTTSDIEGYILSANRFVTEHLEHEHGGDLLEEIEKWVAAHFIASTRERFAQREEAGSAKVEYIGAYGKLLYLTSYGQAAIMLDSSGILKTLSDETPARNISIQAL